MKLAEKLLEVSKSIGYLEKDKSNKMQGYKYLSEAKVKEKIKAAFETQRIIFNYSTDSVREYEISSTSKGTKQFVTIANGKYSFIDCDSEEILTGTWYGSGSDTSDKGLYKAITGGIKYILNTNFLIPTGDDPEKDDDGEDKKPEIKSPVKIIDPDAQLKRDLVEQYKGDKVAAKKEYERILSVRNKPAQEELDDETDKYFKEKFELEGEK